MTVETAEPRDSLPPGGRTGTPAPAWIARLKLTAFRNYASLTLALDRRPVVLTGANGAGKTNLLEAVSFLSPGRGLRRATLDAVGRRPGDGAFAVAAAVETPRGPVELGTGLSAGPEGLDLQRRVRVNQAPARRADDLLDHLRVIWLTPAMDGLFTGSASDRRRFLDRLVLAIDRRHGERVAGFERAMRGRNRLLDEGAADPGWLDAIEAQMAELGTATAAARRELVALLQAMVADGRAASPAFPDAAIALEGTIEAALASGSATEAEDRYRAALAAGRRADRAAGRTLAGPHLTDLAVVHAPKGMPAALCSTGEQKALLVGLVLAHARLTARLTEEAPVLLLDEVAAHLDAARRAALFDALDALGSQAWLTGTDPEAFSPLAGRAQFMSVREATVRPVGEAA